MTKMLKDCVVLVVDDQPDLVELYQLEFEQRKIATLAAYSGNEAIAILKENDVDAIVTDFRMPNGTGLDVFRATKEITHKYIPVIIITGYIEQGVVTALLEGAAAVFSKPISFQDVFSEIEHILQVTSFSQNRRHYARKPLQVKATIVSNNNIMYNSEIETSNISLGGIQLINLFQPLIINEIYGIVLKSNENSIINGFKAQATCKWQRSQNINQKGSLFHAGMAFDEATRKELIVQEIFKNL